MEPQIYERITAMLNRLDGARKDGTKISLDLAALAELSRVDYIPDEELIMKDLETLPFMTGIVKEAIRLSYGPITRLPRVFTYETL
ncbi:trichodiene oxygenase [Colletotrichum filicis]|nr:trichodiene oxygenase [Colletotrichum filicis]